MYRPVYLNRFEKDLKLMQKRGKDMNKFKTLALKLLAGGILPIAANVTLNPIGC